VRLDWLQHPVREDEPSVSLASVYRFLVALSFENLLKGIVIAHGENLGTVVKFGHKLVDLAKKVVTSSAVVFSKEEMRLLEGLEPYLTWAGRYPLPKDPDALIVRSHSSVEHDSELKLWDRLYGHLEAVGWFVKDGEGGRRRLYVTRERKIGPAG